MSPLPINPNHRPDNNGNDGRSDNNVPNQPVGPLRPRQEPTHSFNPPVAPLPAPEEVFPEEDYADDSADQEYNAFEEPAVEAAPEQYEEDSWEGTPAPAAVHQPQQETHSPFSQPVQPVEAQSPVTEDGEDDDSPEAETERAVRRALELFTPEDHDAATKLLTRIMDDESTEVLLNGPTDIVSKRGGSRFFESRIKFSGIPAYHAFINAFILPYTDTADRIGTAEHLIEGLLEMPSPEAGEPPLHARVHLLVPPVTPAARVTIAKKAKKTFTIDALQSTGSMTPSMAEFIKAVAKGRATIVLSGLSGAGKTTVLEAMSHEFDINDRVLVVEDTAELRIPLSDVVPLLATSRKPGQNQADIVTLEWLVAQANRMRPDRIIVGEARGGEFAEFLSAANSGADGSMTTLHASGARQAIDKMVSLAMKSGSSKSQDSVLKDIASTVHIIIQAGLIEGRHYITEIEEVTSTIVTNSQGGASTIATQTLFKFNRSTGRHEVVSRPTDRLTSFLAQRGVKVNPAWFRNV